MGKQLSDYLNSKGWEIELVQGKELFNAQRVMTMMEKDIDLAFIQNDQAHTRESNDIRTVLPFYPNISYIFYRNMAGKEHHLCRGR